MKLKILNRSWDDFGRPGGIRCAKTLQFFTHFHIKTLKMHWRGENSTLKRPWGGLGPHLGPPWAPQWKKFFQKLALEPRPGQKCHITEGFAWLFFGSRGPHESTCRNWSTLGSKWGPPCQIFQFLSDFLPSDLSPGLLESPSNPQTDFAHM